MDKGNAAFGNNGDAEREIYPGFLLVEALNSTLGTQTIPQHTPMYHISQNGHTEGPYQLNELRRRLNAGTLRAHDLVWQEGTTDWVSVSSIPGLVDAGNVYAAPRAPAMAYGPPPPSHLVWAILATCLCCLPFGVVAIVYASKVESHFYAGRHMEALRASKNAKIWSIVSAASIFIPLALFFMMGVLRAAF